MDSIPEEILRLCPEVFLFERLTMNQALRLMLKEPSVYLAFAKFGYDGRAWWSQERECGRPLQFVRCKYDFPACKWESSVKMQVFDKWGVKRDEKRDFLGFHKASDMVDYMFKKKKCRLALVIPSKQVMDDPKTWEPLVQCSWFGKPRVFTTGVGRDIGPQQLCKTYRNAVKAALPQQYCEVYAFDPPWAVGNNCKAYFTYSTPKSLWTGLLRKLPRSKRNFYQWIREDRPCCFYVDAEWEPDQHPELKEEEVFEAMHAYLGQAFYDYFGVDLSKHVCGELAATNEKKVSRHFWWPTVYFEDNHLAMKRFMEFLVTTKMPKEAMRGNPQAKLLWLGEGKAPSVVDHSVYSSNRVWRVFGQCKITSPDRPLLLRGVSYAEAEKDPEGAARVFEQSFLQQPELGALEEVVGPGPADPSALSEGEAGGEPMDQGSDQKTPGPEEEPEIVDFEQGAVPENSVLIRMTQMPRSWGRECGRTEEGKSCRKIATQIERDHYLNFGSNSMTLGDVEERYKDLVTDSLSLAELCYNRSSVRVRKMKMAEDGSSISVHMDGYSDGREKPENAVNCVSCHRAHFSDNIRLQIQLKQNKTDFSCWRNRREHRSLSHKTMIRTLSPKQPSVNRLMRVYGEINKKR